jgi:biotin synthase
MTAIHPIADIKPPRTKAEIVHLLHAADDLQQQLFQSARRVRKEAGMAAVKLRGVIEISNYCQKWCGYCALRPHNKALDRYRMDAETIVAVARGIADEGIATVFLQSGQDPKVDDIVCEAIPAIRDLGVEVLLNLGENRARPMPATPPPAPRPISSSSRPPTRCCTKR